MENIQDFSTENDKALSVDIEEDLHKHREIPHQPEDVML